MKHTTYKENLRALREREAQHDEKMKKIAEADDIIFKHRNKYGNSK